MRIILILSVCCLTALGCTEDAANEWGPLDLTSYNVPVTINAPDSATVVAGTLSGVIDDIIIKSAADRYAIQILASSATTNDMTRLKAEELELVRDNRYFERVVSEEASGFIFENKIDTTSVFGFRHIVYRGDREIVFQNTFDGVYTLPETEAMYESVKIAN